VLLLCFLLRWFGSAVDVIRSSSKSFEFLVHHWAKLTDMLCLHSWTTTTMKSYCRGRAQESLSQTAIVTIAYLVAGVSQVMIDS